MAGTGPGQEEGSFGSAAAVQPIYPAGPDFAFLAPCHLPAGYTREALEQAAEGFPTIFLPPRPSSLPKNPYLLPMKWLGRLIGGIFKLVFYGCAAVLGLTLLLGILSAVSSLLSSSGDQSPEPTFAPDLRPYSLPLTEADGSPAGMLHRLSWTDYQQTSYSGRYGVNLAEMEADAHFRNTIMATGNGFGSFSHTRQRYPTAAKTHERAFFWNWLYERMVTQDSARLPELVGIFDSILLADQPSRAHFAEIIVSAVQHLDYVLVHPYTCSDYVSEDEGCTQFGCQWHREGNACRPEVLYGVQTPVEFAYNLEGDCDTRVLLLMLILRQYGYDARMVWSSFYGHAVLGLDLPAPGKAFVWAEGRKFYLWETTAQNWQLGQIGPEYNNLSHWMLMRRIPFVDR